MVEDNQKDFETLKLILERIEGMRFEIEYACSLDHAKEKLEDSSFDIILSDVTLGGKKYRDIIETFRKKAPSIPLIIMAHLSDGVQDFDTFQHGAQDFWFKEHLGSIGLKRSIQNAIERQKLLLKIEEVKHEQITQKDKLLSHVSHELQTPIAVVRECVSMLSDNSSEGLDSSQKHYFETIKKNVGHLQKMINDLVDIARLEEKRLDVNLQPVSADKILRNINREYDLVAKKKNIKLSVDYGYDLPILLADPKRVTQVLINLVGNAIKFSQVEGEVKVSASISEEKNDFVQFSVKDNGIGIQEQHLKQIFSRNYQVPSELKIAKKGLGLGLFICRQIIEHHGGSIWTQSKVGEGAEFLFTVPVYSLSYLLSKFSAQHKNIDELQVVSVCIHSARQLVSKSAIEKAIMQVREEIKKCSLPDLDILLPRIAYSERGEIFFLICKCDYKGAEVVINRIRRQIVGNRFLRTLRVGLEIDANSVDIKSFRENQKGWLPDQEIEKVIKMQCDLYGFSYAGEST